MAYDPSNFPGFSSERASYSGGSHSFNKLPSYFVSNQATMLVVEMQGAPSGTTTRFFVTQGVNPHAIRKIYTDASSPDISGFFGQ